MDMTVDRRALVGRHAVQVTRIDGTSPLSVGNGEFCYTADVTGLQTFPDRYPVADQAGGPPGTLLGTMSAWGWHSLPGGEHHDPADTTRLYDTPRGPVPYVDMLGEVTGTGESPASAAESWLRGNPHRLDLGRIGLVVTGDGPPRAPDPAELADVRQRLDLWTGLLTSRFRLGGTPVRVTTACHPDRDVLAVRIETPSDTGSSTGPDAGLGVRFAFPYGSQAWGNAADWSRPDAHTTVVRPAGPGWTVDRVLDDMAYGIAVAATGGARVVRTGPHEFVVRPGAATIELVTGFGPGPAGSPGDLPAFDATVSAAARHWAAFWSGGGAVDLSGGHDERAPELERRIVLSQYLTAIHCAGSRPPQETGLMVNSWRGKFHLEMHWWHGAHFPLWGRGALLERSMDWYASVLPLARETARRQGCAGARWPKQTGPDGRESPSPIGPFLVWQQPHPIFLAELLRRTGDAAAAVRRYAGIVLESAAFMASFAVRGSRGYQLGPPVIPAQECYADRRAILTNPTFELAYWAWALGVAQRWRRMLGRAPEPAWTAVAEGMARPCVRDGVYTAVDVPPYTLPDDHPSMLYALGFVPPTPLVDPEIMRATLRRVLAEWPWETTWGWDYPAIAMTAARLGEPRAAVDALLMPVAKNTHLPNGHNRQSAALPVYLPGNGGLLAAVALLARGWDGDGGRPAPGFPPEWNVRHEGLHPLP